MIMIKNSKTIFNECQTYLRKNHIDSENSEIIEKYIYIYICINILQFIRSLCDCSIYLL